MKLYHGTCNRDIENFQINRSRDNLDFGKGIYFTTNFDQAVEWSCKRSETGAVYECDIVLEDFIGYNFSENDDNTYHFIYLCRLGLEEITPDAVDGIENADYVQGILLDGTIREFKQKAELYNSGEISFEEFKEFVDSFCLFGSDKDQVCFKKEKIIAKVNSNITKIYYTKEINGKAIVEY